MEAQQAYDQISHSELQRLAKIYTEHQPSSLALLDKQRYQAIPETVSERKAGGKAYLAKEELVTLIEWKLKHGKWRPNLHKLAASNAPNLVQDVTCEAFAAYESSGAIMDGVNILTRLSGVGPASASLLLSTYDNDGAPFFSDELFRYVHLTVDSKRAIKGWDRPIKYNKAEFSDLSTKVQHMRLRLEQETQNKIAPPCTVIEQAAYVLGNPAYSLTIKKNASEMEGELSAPALVKSKLDKEASKNLKRKRKAETALPATGTRKSARKKP